MTFPTVVKTIITGRNEVVAKVIFLHLSVSHSVHGGGACVAKRGACMVKGGVHGDGGRVWQRGACVAKGGMHGKEGCLWQRGACMVKGGVCAMHPLGHHEIQSVNVRPVRILLECILVNFVAVFLPR